MDVNLYYLYSKNDWAVGLEDRSIFVQEVVLQEHVTHLLQVTRKIQICSDFEKWETYLYVTQWISDTMKFIQRKYFIYKQAAWAQSCLKPFCRFHKMTFYGRSCMIMRPIQKGDRGLFQCPILQINQDFLVHKLFPQFWRCPYENCYTSLKTGSIPANAGAVCITFRCLETVSQMTWLVGELTVIWVKVLNLYL